MVNSKGQEYPVEIKQDGIFFTRILSKEANSSRFSSSSRVYYGGASGAIPFVWESQPGTPKHILATDHNYDSSSYRIPPLTPPPSYYSSTSMPKLSKRYARNLIIKPHNFFRALIFPATSEKSYGHSPSCSTSSSSWSSIYSSPSTSSNKMLQKLRRFSCSALPIRRRVMYDDRQKAEHAIPALFYAPKRRDFRGCSSIGSMKTAFLSILGHGSRQK